MAFKDIIGRSQAWKEGDDGPYTSAQVIVTVSEGDEDTKSGGDIEISFQIGTKREQCYLTVNAEELMLAILRARSKA